MNKNKLSKLTEKWEEQNIITADQGKQILDSTPMAFDKLQKQFPYIFAILGIILVAAGIFKLIANNWEALNQLIKLNLLLVVIGVCYYSGFRLQFQRQKYLRIGEALILLGALLFGAALALITQMYHVNDNFSEGVLVWSIASFLLAYVTSSKSVLVLGLLSFTLWYKLAFPDGYFDLIYLAVIIFFASSFNMVSKSTLKFQKTFQVTGIILMLIINFLSINFMFDQSFNKISKSTLVIVTITALVLIVSFIYESIGRKNDLKQYLTYAVFIFIGSYHLLPINKGLYRSTFFGGAKEPVGMLASIMINIDNIFILALTILLIFLGYVRKERYIVNLAVVFFALHTIFIYFYLMSFQMVAVWFFIIGGIVLLAIAFIFEYLRRDINKRLNDV